MEIFFTQVHLEQNEHLDKKIDNISIYLAFII